MYLLIRGRYVANDNAIKTSTHAVNDAPTTKEWATLPHACTTSVNQTAHWPQLERNTWRAPRAAAPPSRVWLCTRLGSFTRLKYVTECANEAPSEMSFVLPHTWRDDVALFPPSFCTDLVCFALDHCLTRKCLRPACTNSLKISRVFLQSLSARDKARVEWSGGLPKSADAGLYLEPRDLCHAPGLALRVLQSINFVNFGSVRLEDFLWVLERPSGLVFEDPVCPPPFQVSEDDQKIFPCFTTLQVLRKFWGKL